MRLERISTYRLIRFLRLAIPVLVLVLIAVPSWNYVSRRTQTATPRSAQELPKDLAVRTDGFSVSRTEGGRTLFTIRARTNLGFTDNRSMLENVEVIVYGQTDKDPVRRVRSLRCSYDEKSQDIRFMGNVQLELDEKTQGRTEELTYNHRERIIASEQRTFMEQPGTMRAEANQFEYWLDSSSLKLAGDVKVVTAEGTKLETGSALFEQKENRVIATNSVLLESTNGVVRGDTGRADLEPGTFKPRTIVVEGAVTAESREQKTRGAWNLRATWLQASLSSNGSVERVQAKGNVEVVQSGEETKQTLTGGEVDATMDAAGKVELLEARNSARTIMGSDRALRSDTIWRNAAGAVVTVGDSVLEMGDLRVEGRQFTIQQGDIVTFSTPNRASLTSGERQTSADRTEARFESRTNTLLELVQTGSFQFKEDGRQGRSQRARIDDSGNLITLEGSPSVWDSQQHIEAGEIRLNQKNKSFVALQNVRTITKSGDERALVTAGRAEGGADTVIYTDNVQLWRGTAWLKAQKLEASSKENRFHAEGSVQSMMDAVRASSDRLDYDDKLRTAHYTGKVHAQKQNMILETADMTVRIRDNEVSDIVALGNVVLTQGDQRGTGDEAVYDASAEIVTLTGRNAEVYDKLRGVVRGSRLVINRSGSEMAVLSDNPGRTTTKYKVEK